MRNGVIFVVNYKSGRALGDAMCVGRPSGSPGRTLNPAQAGGKGRERSCHLVLPCSEVEIQ